MSYVADEARQGLLETIGEAADALGVALAVLGAAYEQLDEAAGDVLEAELFRPVQLAYARAQRTHAGFAERHALPGRTFTPASAGLASQGVREFLEQAAEAIEDADGILVDLQDSMRPVEVGDPELRAGLAEVRGLIDPLAERARRQVGRFGR
jgi:hypothetical protein